MRRSRSHGILAMSPANPSGTMIGRKALAELGETCRRLGLWFVSDEIYHGLTYGEPGLDGLVVGRRCGRDQLVLEILLHDRLAHRLDRGAGAARAAHRAAGAEPLHLAALSLAGGRAGRLRRHGGAGGREGGICPQPRLSAGGTAPDRHHRDAPGGRRLLHLCRHRPLHERFHRLLASACWRRRASPRRRGWISIPSRARITCACPSPARKTIVARRWPG